MHSINSTLIAKPLQELVLREAAPFLLALSGGPDSIALFHALLDLKIPFGVAHVDHRWREESEGEAKELQKRVEDAGVPFHLKTLDPKKLLGNLEQACREERLKFFAAICKEASCSAVILGHHQDDLAETVLKRILEGASISGWTCMERISKWEGLTLCRPLLHIPKKTILAFLNERKIPYFTDGTNESLEFLRGKMRSKMIPEIEGHLGKSIRGPLARLSLESSELDAFMKERWASKLCCRDFLDCQAIKSAFEMRYVIKHWLKNHALDVSYDVLDDLVEILLSEKSGRSRSFILKGRVLEVDRKKLFLRRPFNQKSTPPIMIAEGVQQWGVWEVEVKRVAREDNEIIGWQAAFKGHLEVFLPEGVYCLGELDQVASKEEKLKIQKKWSDAKIPLFLRELVPVIWSEGGGLAREFFLKCKEKEFITPHLSLCILMRLYSVQKPAGFQDTKELR
jgi:tRNA(Ile)-lysidine synthase